MGRSTGMRISLAVMIFLPLPTSGYSNSNHHWWPVTFTCNGVGPPSGGLSISKSAKTDQIPSAKTKMVGMIVSTTSRVVLPWIWAGLS